MPKRKITPEEIKEIKKLRKEGLSYGDISLKLLIKECTIRYHLDDNYREKIKSTNKTQKSKEYQRKYITVTIYQNGEKYNINFLQDIHEIKLNFQNYEIKYGYSLSKKEELKSNNE